MISSNSLDCTPPAPQLAGSEEQQTDTSSSTEQTSSSVIAPTHTASSITPTSVLNTNQEDEDDLSDPVGPKLVMAVWQE